MCKIRSAGFYDVIEVFVPYIGLFDNGITLEHANGLVSPATSGHIDVVRFVLDRQRNIKVSSEQYYFTLRLGGTWGLVHRFRLSEHEDMIRLLESYSSGQTTTPASTALNESDSSPGATSAHFYAPSELGNEGRPAGALGYPQ